MTRKHIGLKTKLAACIAQMFLTHDEAVALSEDQVLSLVQWDHYPILHTPPYNGPDVHWNLMPRLIGEHRAKTAKIDVPAIAKGKRVDEAQQAFRARLLTPSDERTRRASSFPQGRKFGSRPFKPRRK